MGTYSKIDKSNIFEHDEKMISDTMKFLGANAEEISSFRRLGKFKFSVFLPKSLNKEDQERERNLLKKRHELLESGKRAKEIKIRNYTLYLKNQAVNCTE